MSSVALYRSLIPGHSAVLDATISTWLELAASRHSASAWGAVFPSAMVFWAAHNIQVTPGTGVGSESAEPVGAIISQRDGDLSRTYAEPATATSSSSDGSLGSTTYGQMYLDLRNSRAAGLPTFVQPGPATLAGWWVR